MTLDNAQTARTRSELQANLALTGLTAQVVATDLGWEPRRLDAALDPGGSTDPVDVWELRDYLERTVQDAGATPVPFTVLTRANKLRARTWFHLRRAPRHDFTEA